MQSRSRDILPFIVEENLISFTMVIRKSDNAKNMMELLQRVIPKSWHEMLRQRCPKI